MAELLEKDTRERILDVAERLFAENGFAATSLRTITTEADANLAAVNYHFGSKNDLVREVLARRIDPLNRERLDLLGRFESESSPSGPSLERIVEAFVGPAIRMSQDPARGGKCFMRLFGHAMNQPDSELRDFLLDRLREAAMRFHDALCRALPELDAREVFWRMLFTVGSMAHAMAMSDQFHKITGGLCDARDSERIVRRLVPFIAAGFRTAPPSLDTGERS